MEKTFDKLRKFVYIQSEKNPYRKEGNNAMEIKAAVIEALKELIVPELTGMKSDIQELKSVQHVMNKRLDDHNQHLIELSRRIDATNDRIDATNNRIDKINADMIERFDTINDRIENIRSDLILCIDKLNSDLIARSDKNNDRINQLYLAIVRREEHEDLKQLFEKRDVRIQKLEKVVGKAKTAEMEYETA